MEKRSKFLAWIKENKIISIILLIIFLLAAFFFGVQLYTYFKFILGNDIIVKLSSDKKDFFLENGQQEQVTFRVKGIASPFCSMKCNYYFLDISNNYTISEKTFLVKLNEEKKLTFNISAQGVGRGQDIYRFTVSCHNSKGLFCHTNEKPMRRNILITVNRELNSSELTLKRNLSEKIIKEASNLFILNNSLNLLELNAKNLRSAFELEEETSSIENFRKILINSYSDLENINLLWEQQDYYLLKAFVASLEAQTRLLDLYLGDAEDKVKEKIYLYNGMLDNLLEKRREIESLFNKEFNESQFLKFEKKINQFNQNIKLFEKSRDFANKNDAYLAILELNFSEFALLNESNSSDSSSSFKIEFNLSKIPFIEKINFSKNFTLREPNPKCCLYRICKPCCTNCTQTNYPIIFLHGHDFSESISAEYSINVFDDLQARLNEDGYLIGDEIFSSYYRSSVPGILGMTFKPFTFRASYYYDSLKQSDGYIPVEMKSENIDTYSIRLNELIKEVLFETGKDKVIIIAHSMGGLVARRYIQIFGNSSVDKLILISTPNKGISGKILSYCSFFGSSLECRDMDANSVFMNKLNNYPTQKVKTYVIAGTGCDMDGRNGDGIVLLENIVLESAEKNYLVNGTCSGINLLHGELMRLNKYPETYRIIKEILTENEI